MKLTEHIAKGQSCALRFFPPCSDETVVPCHLPDKTMRGTGMKVPDILTLPGCLRCHDVVDRRGHEWREVPPEMREERMRRALQATVVSQGG